MNRGTRRWLSLRVCYAHIAGRFQCAKTKRAGKRKPPSFFASKDAENDALAAHDFALVKMKTLSRLDSTTISSRDYTNDNDTRLNTHRVVNDRSLLSDANFGCLVQHQHQPTEQPTGPVFGMPTNSAGRQAQAGRYHDASGSTTGISKISPGHFVEFNAHFRES